MKEYDFLVVGSGLFGSTFAYLAKSVGKKVIVVDKRLKNGGNVYCKDVCGINVHKYGPHIFHTCNKQIWDFINGFCSFNGYINQPVANFNGKLYNLPFNMNTFYQMWGVVTPQEAMDKIKEQTEGLGLDEPRNLEEQAIMLVGRDIYETLIKGYTEKQWGMKCSELPSFIIRRLPLRFTYNNNYFNDTYQGIPIGGYNAIIDKMLSGVKVYNNTDFNCNRHELKEIAENIIYTGSIDEYYDFLYGKLQYRSLRFDTSVLDVCNFQGNAVVNYTDSETKYTRIIEHKHFECFGDDVYKNAKTVITKEYSVNYNKDAEPYYPINNEQNNRLYEKYAELSKNETNVFFGGRLGEYKYYDMDKAIESSFALFNKVMS